MAYLLKAKYIHDIQHQALLQKAFAIWGPVQCLTLSVIPEHYRVTFIALVSFFWLILLSPIISKLQGSGDVLRSKIYRFLFLFFFN